MRRATPVSDNAVIVPIWLRSVTRNSYKVETDLPTDARFTSPEHHLSELRINPQSSS